jgi:hypothetical protein
MVAAAADAARSGDAVESGLVRAPYRSGAQTNLAFAERVTVFGGDEKLTTRAARSARASRDGDHHQGQELSHEETENQRRLMRRQDHPHTEGGTAGPSLAPRTIEAPRVDHFPSGRLVYFLGGARTPEQQRCS